METIKDNENKDEVKLTAKEERFCYQYVLHLNATKACILAGYSDKSACVTGSRLLRKAKVQERVKHLKDNLAETAEISALRVLKEHVLDDANVKKAISDKNENFFFSSNYSANKSTSKLLDQMAKQLNSLLLNGINKS